MFSNPKALCISSFDLILYLYVKLFILGPYTLETFFLLLSIFFLSFKAVNCVSHVYLMIGLAITLYIFDYFNSGIERKHLDNTHKHLFPAKTRFLIF